MTLGKSSDIRSVWVLWASLFVVVLLVSVPWDVSVCCGLSLCVEGRVCLLQQSMCVSYLANVHI